VALATKQLRANIQSAQILHHEILPERDVSSHTVSRLAVAACPYPLEVNVMTYKAEFFSLRQ